MAAFDYLRKAANLGSQDVLTMATDDDLKSLRTEPRFTALIARAKQRAAAAQKTNEPLLQAPSSPNVTGHATGS